MFEPLKLEHEFDILEGGQHGHEVERLEHEADRSEAQIGALASRERGDLLAEDHQIAGCRHVQGAHEIQQRRLAASGRTNERHELALPNVEVDSSQCPHLLTANVEDLRHAARDQNRFAHHATRNASAGLVLDANHAGYSDATTVTTIATTSTYQAVHAPKSP